MINLPCSSSSDVCEKKQHGVCMTGAPTRSDSISSDASGSAVAAAIASLQPEAPVGCSTRRHGRFLVQPLMEANVGGANSPGNVRSASPVSRRIGKPPLGPRVQSSPTPSVSFLAERRPSRIIGRFEVCELNNEDGKLASPGSPAATPVKPPTVPK